MEIALAAGTLRVAYQLLIVGIKLDQVPNAVRRCIELVRTCHRDLEDLITLRNESLSMLEGKPAILTRINAIIENAHRGLLEVARLVEKLRPDAHGGNSPFMGRLEWIFIDSREFSSQEPLIARQHSSVIAELNFLRQLILLAPLIDRSGPDHDHSSGVGGAGQHRQKRSVIAWDNVGLLDEMMGGRKQTVPRPPRPVVPTSAPASPRPVSVFSTVGNLAPPRPESIDRRVASPNPSLAESDPPPPYSSSPRPTSTFPPPPTSSSAATNPLIYNVAVPTSGATIGNLYTSQPVKPRTSANAKRTTTFDPDGISFLFGGVKMVSPKPAAVPVAQTATSQYAQQPQPDHQRRDQAHHRPPPSEVQASPVLATKLEQAVPIDEIKPLSTIPQELIHRHDDVRSPPLQPLFSPYYYPGSTTTFPSYPDPTPSVTQHGLPHRAGSGRPGHDDNDDAPREDKTSYYRSTRKTSPSPARPQPRNEPTSSGPNNSPFPHRNSPATSNTSASNTKNNNKNNNDPYQIEELRRHRPVSSRDHRQANPYPYMNRPTEEDPNPVGPGPGSSEVPLLVQQNFSPSSSGVRGGTRISVPSPATIYRHSTPQPPRLFRSEYDHDHGRKNSQSQEAPVPTTSGPLPQRHTISGGWEIFAGTRQEDEMATGILHDYQQGKGTRDSIPTYNGGSGYPAPLRLGTTLRSPAPVQASAFGTTTSRPGSVELGGISLGVEGPIDTMAGMGWNSISGQSSRGYAYDYGYDHGDGYGYGNGLAAELYGSSAIATLKEEQSAPGPDCKASQSQCYGEMDSLVAAPGIYQEQYEIHELSSVEFAPDPVELE